jgi:hypothetical protein
VNYSRFGCAFEIFVEPGDCFAKRFTAGRNSLLRDVDLGFTTRALHILASILIRAFKLFVAGPAFETDHDFLPPFFFVICSPCGSATMLKL